MSDQPLFSVSNHHVASCGVPPLVNDAAPNRYRGYFENEYGEQAIFVYDRDTGEATLYMGDAGWDQPHHVDNGHVPGLILNAAEQAWLGACWLACAGR